MILRLFVMSLVIFACFYLASLAADLSVQHREEPKPLAGLFNGQGAVTVGCSIWDAPQNTGDYKGNSWHDFSLAVDNEDLFLFAVKPDGSSWLISGKQCGESIDWRRFPDKDIPSD